MTTLTQHPVARCGGYVLPVLLCVASIAQAVDIPITPTKLVVVDKLASASKAKTVFVAKDPAITKGPGTDVADISVVLFLIYDGEAGNFLAFDGAFDGTRGWVANKDTVAKYVDKAAPDVTDTKVAVVKPGKLLKLVAKGLGEGPLDVLAQGPPTGLGLVHAIYNVSNAGTEYMHCAVFAECIYKDIAGGTGAKLVCKNGAPDPLCAEEPVACGDAARPECDGACPPGQVCLSVFGGPCGCTDAVGLVAGDCGALEGAPLCYGECPPLAPLCIDDGAGGCACSLTSVSTTTTTTSTTTPTTVPIPCGTYPECNGTCPAGLYCTGYDVLYGDCRCRISEECTGAFATCYGGTVCLTSGDCPAGYECIPGALGINICDAGPCAGDCSCPPTGDPFDPGICAVYLD